MSARWTIGLVLLAAQVIQIGVARVHPMRYYCWAPFDSQNAYQIRATVDGRDLTPAEIWQRYRVQAKYTNPRTIYEVTSTITYVETHYARSPGQVTVTYRTNGGPEQQWHWPPQ